MDALGRDSALLLEGLCGVGGQSCCRCSAGEPHPLPGQPLLVSSASGQLQVHYMKTPHEPLILQGQGFKAHHISSPRASYILSHRELGEIGQLQCSTSLSITFTTMIRLALTPIGRLVLILSVQSLQVAPESAFTKLEVKEIAPHTHPPHSQHSNGSFPINVPPSVPSSKSSLSTFLFSQLVRGSVETDMQADFGVLTYF